MIYVPARQQLAAGAQDVVETDFITKIKIDKTTHTKTGADIFIGKMLERVDNEQYNKIAVLAKKNNGYWSSFSKGFLFQSEEDANKFADAVNGVDIRFRSNPITKDINNQFNAELSDLNAENAQSVILKLGKPSDMLLSAGIPNKELRLYGNKLLKKSQKHGFDVKDVKNLPIALVNPIAVFRGEHPNSFAIITELEINGKKLLATIETDKNGEVDFNFISSVFGKENISVIKWILDGKLLNVDKTKALNFVSASALNADATQNQELYSVTKIIENFVNPKFLNIRQSNSADDEQVSNNFRATNIVQKFNNPTIEEGGMIAEIENISQTLNTPVEIIRDIEQVPASGDVTLDSQNLTGIL